jgi:hypothetical protein
MAELPAGMARLRGRALGLGGFGGGIFFGGYLVGSADGAKTQRLRASGASIWGASSRFGQKNLQTRGEKNNAYSFIWTQDPQVLAKKG